MPSFLLFGIMSIKSLKTCYLCTFLNFFFIQVGSQEKFMRIKQAYNTLLNSKSRSKYDARTTSADFSSSASGGGYQKTGESEEFYGLGKDTCLSSLFFTRFCDI